MRNSKNYVELQSRAYGIYLNRRGSAYLISVTTLVLCWQIIKLKSSIFEQSSSVNKLDIKSCKNEVFFWRIGEMKLGNGRAKVT